MSSKRVHSESPPIEISAAEAKELLDTDPSARLLDVREPDERAQFHLGNGPFIPMNEIPTRFGELPKECPLLVYCAAGIRSFHVVRFLRQNGFPQAQNIAGGIRAWSATP